MSSVTTALKPFQYDLINDPHERIFDCVYEWNNRAKGVGKKHSQYGIFHVLATNAEWTAYAGNDAAGNPIARPVFELPAELAANAAAAAVAQHTRLTLRYQDLQEIEENLKEAIMATLGEVNITFLSDAINGMALVSIRAIKTAMLLKYGVPTAETLRALLILLDQTMKTEDFEAYAAMHRKVHGRLFRAEQALTEFAKCNKLQEGTQNHPGVSEAIKNFKIAHPTVAEQVFEDLVTYVILQKPNMTQTMSTSGYAANVMNASPTVAQLIDAAVTKAFAAQATTSGGKGPKSRLVVGGNLQTASTRYPHYCYKHGYNHTHPGSLCKVMANPPPGTSFSADKVQATSHLNSMGAANGGSDRQG